MLERSPPTDTPVEQAPSQAMIALLATATGAFVANLYYSQSLVGSIGTEIGISPALVGSIVSLTQAGFGLGLFFLVCLADLVENRKLILSMLLILVGGLVGMALATNVTSLFVASLAIGLCASATQVLVPFVARMAPEAQRGRAVGSVMAGLLTGIMLARPISLFITAEFGWRAVFWSSAVLMLVIGAILARMMPRYQPPATVGYRQIIGSMVMLLMTRRALQRRAAYQALMFAAFSMFWTTAPLLLSAHFGLSQHSIALFALAGAGGALVAPVVGRLTDRGFVRPLTAGAMILMSLSFFATAWAVDTASLAFLVVLAVLIDVAVQGGQIASQRIVFAVATEIRGRTNAIFMTMVFIGGGVGSLLGTVSYEWGGWDATACIGGGMGILMLLLFATEPENWRGSKPRLNDSAHD